MAEDKMFYRVMWAISGAFVGWFAAFMIADNNLSLDLEVCRARLDRYDYKNTKVVSSEDVCLPPRSFSDIEKGQTIVVTTGIETCRVWNTGGDRVMLECKPVYEKEVPNGQ